MVQPAPVNDITAIRNIPLNENEIRELVNTTTQQALKAGEEAMLKATPKAVSPYKLPSGRIKGETGLTTVVSGRDLGSLLPGIQTEYTQEQWEAAEYAAGKIPLDVIVLKKLQINGYAAPELTKWRGFLDKLKYPHSKVTIGLIGKYIELQDAYKSILESFIHAGAINECKVQIVNVHSEFITDENVKEKLKDLDGLLGRQRLWSNW